MAKRTIYSVDFKSGKKAKLASFELIKGKVVAKYSTGEGPERMKRAIENGLVMLKGEVVKPEDGKDFYDGLMSTFAQSSTVAVIDTK